MLKKVEWIFISILLFGGRFSLWGYFYYCPYKSDTARFIASLYLSSGSELICTFSPLIVWGHTFTFHKGSPKWEATTDTVCASGISLNNWSGWFEKKDGLAFRNFVARLLISVYMREKALLAFLSNCVLRFNGIKCTEGSWILEAWDFGKNPISA